jgi:DNA repair exonuclease SbcCD ATPase subunit
VRITNCELHNYIGLVEGTSRSEIAINFEPAYEAGLRRCFALGRNGSGKTTLLNSLTPFPSNGDDRELIVPGRNGRKLITFARGHNLPDITCDIKWSTKGKVTACMYEGEEIVRETAKGNQGEYLQAVKDYLGVTPDYLRMGRVTGRIGNFLDQTPGERKKFIGRFLPEVEEWAEMNKHAAKRLQLLKAQLSGLQVELDRIDSREELEASSRRAEADSSRLREELRRHDTRLGSARGAIAELEPARAEVLRNAGVTATEEFNPLPTLASRKTGEAETAEARVETIIRERPTLERFRTLEAAQEKVAQVREGLGHARGVYESSTSRRSESRTTLDRAIQAETAATRSLRQAADSDTQLTTLASQAKELEGKVVALTEQADGLPGAPDGLTYDEVKATCDMLGNLEAELAAARSAFPTPATKETAAKAGLDDGVMLATESALASRCRELREKIDVARSRIATIEAQAQFHSRFSGMHCNDPKCPYERYVGQFATAAEELAGKKEEIERLEERLSSAEAERTDMTAARAAAKQALTLHARLRRHRSVLEAAGVWASVGPAEAFVELLCSTGTASAETLSARNLLQSLATKRELSEARRSLDSVREREENLRLLAAAKVELEAAAVRASEEVTAARAALAAADDTANKAQGSVNAQEAALKLLEQLIDLQQRAASARNEATRLFELSSGLEHLRDRWETAQAEASEATQLREETSTALGAAERSLGEARLRLGRRDEYEARLAEMAGKVRTSQLVAEACHPARGAPVEFLRDFLDSTRDGVNALLDIALGGEFRLGFVVSDSEFRVPVSRGSGRVISDVTESSDGQLALAKTVLSMALVRQTVMSTGGYNVICLDECDGPLDRERNRERFVEIIDRLMQELGVEQLFAISHNDCFHAAPAGLILLPGHAMPIDDPGFMANKIILGQFD